MAIRHSTADGFSRSARHDQRSGARLFAAAALFAAALLPMTGAGEPAPEADRLAMSRSLTVDFGKRLRAALEAALAEGGPRAAIAVCKDTAPAIASELSRRSGAKVGRTSDRVRNPANAPEPWQVRVLAELRERSAASEPAEFHTVEAGRFVYMRAIHTGPECLVCHGEQLAADVAAELAEAYPHDRARGYAPGELRGAFSVVWPAP